MSSCLICDKHQDLNQVFIKSGTFTKLYHYFPSQKEPYVYKGHLFVEPKRHITCASQLNEAEAHEIGEFISLGAKIIKKVFEVEHIYNFNIGHMVPHLHFHLVPRYPNTPKEYWGGMQLHQWPDAPFVGLVEVKKIQNQMIQVMNRHL